MDLRDLTGKCQHLGHNEGGAAGRLGPGWTRREETLPKSLSSSCPQGLACTDTPLPRPGGAPASRPSCLIQVLTCGASPGAVPRAGFYLRRNPGSAGEKSPDRTWKLPGGPAQLSPAQRQVRWPTRAPDKAPTWLMSCHRQACLPSPPGGLLHSPQNCTSSGKPSLPHPLGVNGSVLFP